MDDRLTAPHPLACPRCGCPDSRVIASRRKSRSEPPQPLPAMQRTRKCESCQKQFRTNETVAEQDLQSTAWRVRIGQRVWTEALPEGEYSGTWTRYEVTVAIDEQVYTLDTRNDMRVADYPCRVTVGAVGITVESGS